MSCSDKTHKVHEWATAPGSTLAIQDCERSCHYCSLDKSPGLRWIYTSSRPLRNHVQKVHLDSGQHPGVTLLPEKPNIPTRRSSKGVSATQMLRRSDDLPPHQKLEFLADLLCLPPEHRKEFQRMVLGHFAGKQTIEDEAISSMIEALLTNHGPALWPANSRYRNHLQASQQEDFWSQKWKKTTIVGPVYALDARMTRPEKRWRRSQSGKDPSEREEVLGSRLGLAMNHYVRTALKLRDPDVSTRLTEDEIIELRDAITAKHLQPSEPESSSRKDSRDCSPEVPLRLVATKQGHAKSPDSSPELPLMTLRRPELSVTIPPPETELEQVPELPTAHTLSAADCLDVLQELGAVSEDDSGSQKDGSQAVEQSTAAQNSAADVMDVDTAESINTAPPEELSLPRTGTAIRTTAQHTHRLSRVGSDQQTGPEDFFQQVSDALTEHLRSESSAEDAPSPRTVKHATALWEDQQNRPSSLQPGAPDGHYPSIFDLAPGSTTGGIPWLLPYAPASSVPAPSGHRISESRLRGSVSNLDVAHDAQALDASASNLNAAEEAHLEQRVRQDNRARKRRPRFAGFRNAPLSEAGPTPTLFRPGFGNFGEPVDLPRSQQINATTTSASGNGESSARGFLNTVDTATSNAHPAFNAPLPHPRSIGDEMFRLPSSPRGFSNRLVGLPTQTRLPSPSVPSNSIPSPTAPAPTSTGVGMLIPQDQMVMSPKSSRKRRRVPSAGGMGVSEPGSQHAPRSSLSREYVPHQGQEDTVGPDRLTNAERERLTGYMRDTGGLGGLPFIGG